MQARITAWQGARTGVVLSERLLHALHHSQLQTDTCPTTVERDKELLTYMCHSHQLWQLCSHWYCCYGACSG